MYVCMFPESRDVYATLLRARRELGFSIVVQLRFAITGREREEGEERKGSFLTKPDSSIFFQRQLLELTCDSFSCLGNIQRARESL